MPKTSERPALNITMAVAFQEVSNGKKCLLASYALEALAQDRGVKYGPVVQSAFGISCRVPHGQAKSISLPADFKNKADVYLGRVLAVGEFLKNIKPVDKLLLVANDRTFLDAISNQEPEAGEAALLWQKISENKNITVVPVTDNIRDRDPFHHVVSVAQRRIKLKVANLDI